MNIIPLAKLARNVSRKFDFNKHSKVVFINTGDVLNNDFLHNNLSEIGSLPGQAKKAIKKGDILYSEIRPGNGRYLFVNKELDNFVVSTKFMVIEANQDFVLPEYLFLLLISNEVTEYFKTIAEARSGTFPQITFDAISHYEINIPSREKQKAIVNYIFSIDKKIQLNTQTNQTLEAIAQAIFKSWFIDFDPVKAKAQVISEGKTAREANLAAMAVISGKAVEELNETEFKQLWEIAEAFPSEMMVSEEFGEMPKGWEVKKIGEVLETVGGATPSTKNNEFWDNGDIYWTTPKDLSSLTDKILLNTERKITQVGVKKISSGVLPINTVLLSSRAPVGYLALTKIPVAINQGYIAIKNSKNLNCYYTLQWCVANMSEIKSRAVGTTFAEISKSVFREIPIILPNSEILSFFEDQLNEIYNKITENLRENQNLAETRDLLLPKLLNGEI